MLIKFKIYINGRYLTQKLSGTQRFAHEIAKKLSIINQSVVILVPQNAQIVADYETADLRIEVIGRNRGVIWEQIDLPLFLRKHKYPLLINLVNTAPISYHFQFVTIHDMAVFVNPKWFSRAFSTYYHLIVPVIARKSLQILTVSNSSKSDILKYIKVPQAKIKIIDNGISEVFFNKPEVYDFSIIKNFQLEHKKYILAVSSLDPRKNFKRLIDAYLLTNQSYPLVIVGSKGNAFANQDLDGLLTEKIKVIFTGYVNNLQLKTLYCNAICFVYPSLFEGFGIPPLEAMACGCPTIVSNLSSMPEICGNASFYIDPLNLDSISNAIVSLINNKALQQELVVKGFKRIKLFSWHKSAEKVLRLINEFI